jgi:hypothetical protein
MGSEHHDIDDVLHRALHQDPPQIASAPAMRARVEQRTLARRRRANTRVSLVCAAAAAVLIAMIMTWDAEDAGPLGVLGRSEPPTTAVAAGLVPRTTTTTTTTEPEPDPSVAESSESAGPVSEGGVGSEEPAGRTTTTVGGAVPPPPGDPTTTTTSTTPSPPPCSTANLVFAVELTRYPVWYLRWTNTSSVACLLVGASTLTFKAPDGTVLATSFYNSDARLVAEPGWTGGAALVGSGFQGCPTPVWPDAVTVEATFVGTDTWRATLPGAWCMEQAAMVVVGPPS